MRPHFTAGTGTWFVAGAGVLLLAGCGGSGVQVSGEVNFDGKPLPAGRIYFNPDFAKGNDGPQGYARIKDGKFNTRTTGKGACGGPTIVVIQGYDGSDPAAGALGKPLFKDYSVAIDLAMPSAPQKFDVPAAAADTLPKGPRPTRKP